jgi:hypothetical protein
MEDGVKTNTVKRDITVIKARPLRWGGVGRNLPKPAVL